MAAQSIEFDVFFAPTGDAAIAVEVPHDPADPSRASLAQSPDGFVLFRNAGEGLPLVMDERTTNRLLALDSVVIVETRGPEVVAKYAARVVRASAAKAG